MTKEKIKRINELAKKSKKQALTKAELKEQKELRDEYINSVKNNLKAQLKNIKFTKDKN